MLSLAQRLAARIEQLDTVEDGDGFILGSAVGARISSYTGPHGWNSDAGHVVPSAEPLLLRVAEEVESVFDRLPPDMQRRLHDEFLDKHLDFVEEPTMANLIAMATVVDSVARLYVATLLSSDGDETLLDFGESF